MNNFTLEEIQLGLEVYEKLLLQEAYLKGDKQSLTEIKLSFKGIKDLGQKALDKFKSLATPEKTFVGILGKLRKETNKEAKEIINFFKKKASEYKGKSIEDIQKDVESLFSEFTGEKLEEALTAKQRVIGGFIALGIYLMSLVPTVAASYDAITDINPNPDIEMTTPVDLDGGDKEGTIGFDDAKALASAGGDISHNDVQDGVNAQGVKVNLGDIGGALSFDTGEFDASQTDIDKVAQDAVDNLVKNLDGKDLKKVSIDPYGLISNTPGDQDNNPNGPGDTGLDGKRLDTAKKIADKVQDLLKDKYPDADISIGDGVTNGDSVDGQKEVPKGSDASSKTQVAGVSFDGLETGGDAPAEKDIVKPDVAKARLIDPKLELEDKSRYRALLSLFLPLLIDDYEATMEKVSISLQLEDSDFPVTRGKMEKKLAEIKVKENKDENDELAIKILEWSIGTSKSPSTLLNNINRLDPKVALGKRQLKKSLRPGQRGKNMGIAGTGKTQGNTGDQVTSPASGNEPGNRGPSVGSTVGESVLLEAKTDFSELPNYNQGKAKSNLGILVPLYSAYWASEPGKTADGTTLPTGFDIDYVMNTYKDSWRKFEKDYPVIVGKVKFDDYVDYGTDKKSSSTTDKDVTPPESMDAKPDGVEKDAEKINKAIDQNTTAKAKLALINTKAELQLLLKNILMLTNQNFAKQDSTVKQYMMVIANQIKAVKEGNEDVDVNKVIKILMLPSIKNKILMINNKAELKDLIVNVILPNVHPTLRKNLAAMRGAVIGAGNAYKYDASELDERDLSKSVEKIAQRLPDAEFKKRYGKNWKSVKIATAEKLAEMSELDEASRTKQGKKVSQKYLKGLKGKGTYGSKEAMKKEIDKFAGKDTYKKDWYADHDDEGKRLKTKRSAASKAYEKMFGESIDTLLFINENSDKALKNKAKKSKIPLSILRAVYRKGKAAWNTGHRPGSSQDQWAMGRVNSFITGSGGARKADAKLWARAKKARGKKRKSKK